MNHIEFIHMTVELEKILDKVEEAIKEEESIYLNQAKKKIQWAVKDITNECKRQIGSLV